MAPFHGVAAARRRADRGLGRGSGGRRLRRDRKRLEATFDKTLENKRATLPLKRGITRLAVIGSEAEEARYGGYSGPGIDRQAVPASVLFHK